MPWVNYSCLVKSWGFNGLPGPGDNPPQEHESKLLLQQEDYTENMWEFVQHAGCLSESYHQVESLEA